MCNNRINAPFQILDFGFPFDAKSVVGDWDRASCETGGDTGSLSSVMEGTGAGALAAPEPGRARIASRRAETASTCCSSGGVLSV
jgi:hypothetical protein